MSPARREDWLVWALLWSLGGKVSNSVLNDEEKLFIAQCEDIEKERQLYPYVKLLYSFNIVHLTHEKFLYEAFEKVCPTFEKIKTGKALSDFR